MRTSFGFRAQEWAAAHFRRVQYPQPRVRVIQQQQQQQQTMPIYLRAALFIVFSIAALVSVGFLSIGVFMFYVLLS